MDVRRVDAPEPIQKLSCVGASRAQLPVEALCKRFRRSSMPGIHVARATAGLAGNPAAAGGQANVKASSILRAVEAL